MVTFLVCMSQHTELSVLRNDISPPLYRDASFYARIISPLSYRIVFKVIAANLFLFKTSKSVLSFTSVFHKSRAN